MSGGIRVLHVTQPTEGGVAGYVAAACADQVARGWDVAVACPDRGRLVADLTRLGIEHLTWRATRNPGPASAGETLRLGREIERWQPQVVHLHAAKAGLAGRLLLRGELPTLFQPHGWSWLAVDGALRAASLAWERLAARWSGRTVCVGDEEAEQGRARGVGGRFTVVRNGVDLQRFRPAGAGAREAARAALGVGRDVPLAVCIGRVTRQKGQDLLISAWSRVRRDCPTAELHLVGDGDLLPALRAAAGPGIGFAGAVADVRAWLAAADLVVLPSRWEGLPLTALEALASGRCVVVSAVPGLTEVIAPSVGALVPVEDPAALADAVIRRFRDPSLCQAEGRAAARHAARFDLRDTFELLAAATTDVAATAGIPVGRRTAVSHRGRLKEEQRAW